MLKKYTTKCGKKVLRHLDKKRFAKKSKKLLIPKNKITQYDSRIILPNITCIFFFEKQKKRKKDRK